MQVTKSEKVLVLGRFGGELTIMLMIIQGLIRKQAPFESRGESLKRKLQMMLTANPYPVKQAHFFSKNPILKSSQGHFLMKQNIPLKKASLRMRFTLPRQGMWISTALHNVQNAPQQARKIKLFILLLAPLKMPTFSFSQSSPYGKLFPSSLLTLRFHLALLVAASQTSPKQKNVQPQVRMVTNVMEQQYTTLMKAEQEDRYSKILGNRMQIRMTCTMVLQRELKSFLDSGWISLVCGWVKNRIFLSQSGDRESLIPNSKYARFCIFYYCILIMSVYAQKGTVDNILFQREGFELVGQEGCVLEYQLKLGETEEAQQIQRQYGLLTRLVFQLLKEYLSKDQDGTDVWSLNLASFGESHRSSFLKYLQELNMYMQRKFKLGEILQAKSLESVTFFQNLMYLSQSRQLLDELDKLRQKQKQLAIVQDKRVAIDAKKLQVYDTLLYNCELRTRVLVPSFSNAASKAPSQSILRLKQQLEQLKEKEHLMKKIVQNGGWGLLAKIRERVVHLKANIS